MDVRQDQNELPQVVINSEPVGSQQQLTEAEHAQLQRIESRLASTKSDILSRIDQTQRQLAQLTASLTAQQHKQIATNPPANIPNSRSDSHLRLHAPLRPTRSAVVTPAADYVASFTTATLHNGNHRYLSPTPSFTRHAVRSRAGEQHVDERVVTVPVAERRKSSARPCPSNFYRSRPPQASGSATNDEHSAAATQGFRSRFYARLAAPHGGRHNPTFSTHDEHQHEAEFPARSRIANVPHLSVSKPPSPSPSSRSLATLTVRHGAHVHMLNLPGGQNDSEARSSFRGLKQGHPSLIKLNLPAGNYSSTGMRPEENETSSHVNSPANFNNDAETAPVFKFPPITEQSYRDSHDDSGEPTVAAVANTVKKVRASASITNSISSGTDSPQRVRVTHADELELMRLRTNLQEFFSDPVSKFSTKRRVIIRPLIQVVKMILVTAQLFIFSDFRFPHIDFVLNNRLALGKLLLNDTYFAVSTDKYLATDRLSSDYFYGTAVETKDEFYEVIEQALYTYHNIEQLSIGSYYNRDLRNAAGQPGDLYNVVYCVTSYKKARFYPDERLFSLDARTLTNCTTPTFPIMPSNANLPAEQKLALRSAISLATFGVVDPHLTSSSAEDDQQNRTRSRLHGSKNFVPVPNGDYDDDEDPIQAYFDRLIRASLTFRLDTVHVWDMERYNVPPICYALNASIIFDNSGHFGRVLVSFVLQDRRLSQKDCGNWPENAPNRIIIWNIIVHAWVLVITSLSLFLCVRSLYNGNRFRSYAQRILHDKLAHSLTWSEKIEFIGKWTVLNVCTDLIIITATMYRLCTSVHDPDTDLNSIMMGIGNLLVWIGALRYLSFFPKYNVLLLTIKKSMPSVARYCVCAVIIYIGFALCGWLAFGPYHPKFRTWSASCEALFSMANGDDINNAFAVLGDQVSLPLWFFFRIYLYLYISLFTYVVLNVFLSLILDAYGFIKDYDEGTVPQSILRSFVTEGAVPDAVELPSHDDNNNNDERATA